MRTIIKTPSLKNLLDTNQFFPNPFGILMEDLNHGHDHNHKNNFVPAVNVAETNEKFELHFRVAGYAKEDLNIALENNTLTVSAQNKETNTENESNFLRKEFSYKAFTRTFNLPENIDAEGLTAKYENGILNIAIPKKVEEKTENKRVIEIN